MGEEVVNGWGNEDDTGVGGKRIGRWDGERGWVGNRRRRFVAYFITLRPWQF